MELNGFKRGRCPEANCFEPKLCVIRETTKHQIEQIAVVVVVCAVVVCVAEAVTHPSNLKLS
jgi:hypothetical protein